MLFNLLLLPVLLGFLNLVTDPRLELSETFPQIGQQFVGFLDVAVQITQIAFLSPRFHGAGGAAHMDCGNLLTALPLVRSEIDPLRLMIPFQILILNHLPAVTPFFTIGRIVPIVHVFPMADPFSAGNLHPVSVAVQFVYLPAFWHPLSLLVQRTER